MPQLTLRVYNFVVRVEAVPAAGARHVTERHGYSETEYQLRRVNFIRGCDTYPGIEILCSRYSSTVATACDGL